MNSTTTTTTTFATTTTLGFHFVSQRSGTGQRSITVDGNLLAIPTEAFHALGGLTPPAELGDTIPNPGYVFRPFFQGALVAQGDVPIKPEFVLAQARAARARMSASQLFAIREAECLAWFLELVIAGRWSAQHLEAYELSRDLMSQDSGRYGGRFTTFAELEAETRRRLGG